MLEHQEAEEGHGVIDTSAIEEAIIILITIRPSRFNLQINVHYVSGFFLNTGDSEVFATC